MRRVKKQHYPGPSLQPGNMYGQGAEGAKVELANAGGRNSADQGAQIGTPGSQQP